MHKLLERDFDVVVAGASVDGAAAAISLASRGYRTKWIDSGRDTRSLASRCWVQVPWEPSQRVTGKDFEREVLARLSALGVELHPDTADSYSW